MPKLRKDQDESRTNGLDMAAEQAPEEAPESLVGLPSEEIDSLQIYFRQMAENPLLTPAEELSLATAYRACREAFRRELYGLGFVATEHLRLLEGLVAEHLDNDFELPGSGVPGQASSPEAWLSTLQQWGQEIATNYRHLKEGLSRKVAAERQKALRQRLGTCLLSHPAQGEHLHEWYEVAKDYLAGLGEATGRSRQNTEFREFLAEKLLLSPVEFKAVMARLAQLQSQADEQRDGLLKGNLRLVVSVARRHYGRGLPLVDLIQEGNLGLMKAVDRFDPGRGHRFSTYAIWWIRQAVGRAVGEQSRVIRIPAHMIATLTLMSQAEQRFLQEQGREPDPEELAKRLDMPMERVRALRRMAQQPISLQAPADGVDGHLLLEDLLAASDDDDPIKAVAYSMLREKLREVLGTLSEREQQILRHRFGLFGETVTTLDHLSLKFGISRERVRQIEVKAMEKLRQPNRSKLLDGYFR